MKKFFWIISFLLFAALLGCGSGGGGGGVSPPPASNTSSYVVSTVNLGNPNPLNAPVGIALDGLGNLYVTDAGANLVRKIVNANSSASVSTILGGGGTDYSFCLNSRLDSPYGIAIDSTGNLFVAEVNKSLIRYADCATNPSVSAQYGSTGAGLALLNPSGVALRGGNLYVSDTGNHLIRVITNNGGSSGTTSTLAGTTAGYVNGPTGLAAFSSPSGVAISSSGSIFVADTSNCAIRQISSGQVSTFAGAGPSAQGTGSCGSSDGAAAAAQFNQPTGMAVDASNNLYVADTANNRIRRITPAGLVTTIAGTGVSGAGDGNGSSATFNAPTGIVIDPSGNIFVIDSGNSKIRKVTLAP